MLTPFVAIGDDRHCPACGGSGSVTDTTGPGHPDLHYDCGLCGPVEVYLDTLDFEELGRMGRCGYCTRTFDACRADPCRNSGREAVA